MRKEIYAEVVLAQKVLEMAKGNDGEIVAWNESGVREEVLRRSAKAGYSTSNGEPTGATKIMSRGFGESKLNIWPRDKNGQLIGD